MAKKSRTPEPPRRVQAPQARHAPRQGLTPERKRSLLLYGGATAAAIGLIIVLVFVLRGGGDDLVAPDPTAVAAQMRAAGCTFKEVPATPGGHINAQNDAVTYATYPPTSGMHHPTPSILGNYRQAVDPRQAVHNLEHGNIVVWYGPDVTPENREAIDRFYDESPNAVLVTPIEGAAPFVKYPKHDALTSQIALSAWIATVKSEGVEDEKGLLAVCPNVNVEAFEAFRDTFRGKGPERVPVDSMTPGT